MLTDQQKLDQAKKDTLKLEQKALKKNDFDAAIFFARRLLRLDIQEAVITGKVGDQEYATLI